MPKIQHFNIRLGVIKEANKVINPDYANKGYSLKFWKLEQNFRLESHRNHTIHT